MEPIELTEAELRAVSGGANHSPPPTDGDTVVIIGILQRNSQSASIAQSGGSVTIGGSGPVRM